MASIIRRPQSYGEAWQILRGRREGDVEQAEAMVQDPDVREKGRDESRSRSRLHKIQRPLGSPPMPIINKRYL